MDQPDQGGLDTIYQPIYELDDVGPIVGLFQGSELPAISSKSFLDGGPLFGSLTSEFR